jgi:hypothetical protein
MRLASRRCVAVVLLAALALLAPSLVSHGHARTSGFPDPACAKCALAHGATPAAGRADVAVSPVGASQPVPLAGEARFVSKPRTTAVPRGPPSASF